MGKQDIKVEKEAQQSTVDGSILWNKAIFPHRKYENRPSKASSAVGKVFAMVLWYCSIVGHGFVYFPMLVFKRYSIWNYLCAFGEYHFFTMIAGYFQVLQGMRFNVHADASCIDIQHKKILVISNHRTEIDWIFQWNLAAAFDMQHEVRIVLKHQLRKIPGFGWMMDIFEFIFVKRDWTVDKNTLTTSFNRYRNAQSLWLCMFPEGTSLCPKSFKQNIVYATKNQLPVYHYVLHPRVKGFHLAIKEFQPDYILDVTAAYPELINGIRPSPLRFLNGLYPRQVDLQLTAHPVSTITNPETWLQDRYTAKEQTLQQYYTSNGTFSKPRQQFTLPNFWLSFFVSFMFIVGTIYMLTISFFRYWILITIVAGFVF